MGLMDIGASNPYATINPLAVAIEQGLKGFTTERDRFQEQQKAKQLAAQQAELLNFQRQEAQRKQAQAALETQARETLARRLQGAASSDGFRQGPTEPIRAPYGGLMAQQDAALTQQPGLNPVLAGLDKAFPADTSQPAASMGTVTPFSAQDLLGVGLEYAGTDAGKSALEIYKSVKPETSLARKAVESVLANPDKYDAKTLQTVSALTGVDLMGKDKSVYKQRQYEKGNQIINEFSEDDGKTWKPLSAAPRYKPSNGNSYMDGPLAQTSFVDPASGKPLVYDKKTGSYRVANVEGVAKQVPVKVASELSANAAAISKLDNALQLAESNPSAFGMSNYLGDEVRQRTDPRGVPARAAVADIGSLTIHDRSGAAVTASEFPRLKPFIPAATDSPKTVKEKLARFKQIVSEEDRLYRQGLTSNGYRVGGNQPSSPPRPRPGFKVQRNKTTGEYREVPI